MVAALLRAGERGEAVTNNNCRQERFIAETAPRTGATSTSYRAATAICKILYMAPPGGAERSVNASYADNVQRHDQLISRVKKELVGF